MRYQLIIIFNIGACWAAPADDPIRVDLPVYDEPQHSSVQLAQRLEMENHPGDQPRNAKGGPVGNLITQKLQPAINILGSGSQVLVTGGRTREDALQETEGWGSQTLSIKENVQNVVAGIFQPKPIVDTIREEEKYGNSGDKFSAAGRAVVGGAAGVSNLVNNLLEVPANIFKVVARAATEKLNNLGGKIVGLN